MKKTILFIAVIISLNACITINTIFPSGNITSETRYVDYFNKISVSSGIQLIVYNGEQDVLVETYENFLCHVQTYVRNNCLYIRPESHISFGGNARVKVYVTAEIIESIDASGGSKVYIPALLASNKLSLTGAGGSNFDCEKKGEIQCNRLFVDIAGGGKADLYIDCAYMDASSSGGGKLYLEGFADVVDMNISGGGKMEGFYLDVVEMYLKMSGGGHAEVNVSDYLSAKLSGGSKVYYRGTPSIDADTTGGSKVIQD